MRYRITKMRLIVAVVYDAVNILMIIFQVVALATCPVSLRGSDGWRLLVAYAPTHAYTQLYHCMQTVGKFRYFLQYGPGSTDALPGWERKLQCLAIFYTLAVFAQFALMFGIALKYFPPQAGCGDLNNELVCVCVLYLGVLFTVYCFMSVGWILLWSISCCFRRDPVPETAVHFFRITAQARSMPRNEVVSPTQKLELYKSLPMTKEKADEDPCVICLEKGPEYATWRILPCGHQFHPNCVDVWLAEKGTCPCCRSDPLDIFLKDAPPSPPPPPVPSPPSTIQEMASPVQIIGFGIGHFSSLPASRVAPSVSPPPPLDLPSPPPPLFTAAAVVGGADRTVSMEEIGGELEEIGIDLEMGGGPNASVDLVYVSGDGSEPTLVSPERFSLSHL